MMAIFSTVTMTTVTKIWSVCVVADRSFRNVTVMLCSWTLVHILSKNNEIIESPQWTESESFGSRKISSLRTPLKKSSLGNLLSNLVPTTVWWVNSTCLEPSKGFFDGSMALVISLSQEQHSFVASGIQRRTRRALQQASSKTAW